LFIGLTPFRFLLGNPIPFFPFPLSRGRGAYIREASPPFDSPFKEGEEILERGFAPLLPMFPLITSFLAKGLKGAKPL